MNIVQNISYDESKRYYDVYTKYRQYYRNIQPCQSVDMLDARSVFLLISDVEFNGDHAMIDELTYKSYKNFVATEYIQSNRCESIYVILKVGL